MRPVSCWKFFDEGSCVLSFLQFRLRYFNVAVDAGGSVGLFVLFEGGLLAHIKSVGVQEGREGGRFPGFLCYCLDGAPGILY